MKPFQLKIIPLVLLLLFANACANYKMHTSAISGNDLTNIVEPSSPFSHSLYLVGNTGGDPKEDDLTIQLLKTHLEKAPKQSTLLFLGDQLGTKGMPSRSASKKRAIAEKKLDAQLSILKNFKGRPIFLPGNSDWNVYGLKGLKRQEKYIEETLNEGIEDDDDWENYFLPDDGCPGPEVIEVNEQLVIIIIDTQWWLMDWDEQPNVNEGCEVKSREAFEMAILEEIKDHKNKNIVFATHHAFQSVGPQGGNFTARQHLFPFTVVNDKAYVPLPIVGTAYLMLRKAGISPQDISNRHYKELVDAVLKPAKEYGEFIFTSASEHSLQYITAKGQHFVNSGGGGLKNTATAKNVKALFSYGENGFSKIDFYKDGSAWIEFWVPDATTAQGKMVFRKQMKGPLPKVKKEDLLNDFPIYESGVDSVYTSPSSRNIKPLGKFATFMLGERRRSLYLEKYNFPTLDLSSHLGGMKVIKKGGGKQTNSLRLETSDGREYALRSLTKDANRGVPYPFNQLPYVNYLFSETFLGSHCFAPLSLGVLSDAAKVYHTNPGLYYVPKQPALGTYNDMFGGEVYLLEERPSKEWPEAEFFGNAEKFVSTPKLNQKREKNHKHRVDQRWVVRSRLFDMLIGDIDRHGDQWRWTSTKTPDGNKIYRPIPRDRDNAYSTYDGFAFKILRPYHPIVRQLNVYEEEVGNPKWSYYNARHFDHNFMNEMTLEDWLAEAKYIQENVTDEVIAEALDLFPAKVAELTRDQVASTLKIRRERLTEIATEFYKQLSKKAIVHGIDKKELFEIIRLDDEHTEIKMYDSNKEGDKQELLYRRIFKTSETKEVYLYGLGDDDIFRISGSVGKSIRLHLVGGAGEDQFFDSSKVDGFGKKDKIYDTREGNKLELGSEGKNKTSNDALNNIYEPLGHQFDEGNLIGAPIAGFNAGDGVTVGLLFFYKVYKFNKYPMGQKHRLKLNYAFATRGIDLNYASVFYEAIGRGDFVLNSELRNDRYSFNYFGLGNESEAANNEIDDYRVLQSKVYLDAGWQQRFARDIATFSLRPLVQFTSITDTEDRFIDSDDNGLTSADLEKRWYAGVASGLNFGNTDNDVHPHDGFRFNNTFTWQRNLTGTYRNFRTFGSDFTIYKSFGKRKALIFATRLGTAFIRGDYDFFFAPTLGEDENIRGYFGQRYRGETSFYQITDLRMALGSVKNAILPFSIGITGSFDYGRVFLPGEESEQWHSSVGGGIWLVPLNIAIIRFSYNHTLDNKGGRFNVGVGHAF